MTLPPPDRQSIREAIAREESRFLRIEKELGGADPRRLRKATGQVWRVFKPGIPNH
jgi:hypothetical protein